MKTLSQMFAEQEGDAQPFVSIRRTFEDKMRWPRPLKLGSFDSFYGSGSVRIRAGKIGKSRFPLKTAYRSVQIRQGLQENAA